MAYVWQRWMADEYREAGLKVVEVAGWKNRGRPASTGSFNPQGPTTDHHTGTKTSASRTMPTLQTLIKGRPDLPGPLCQNGIGFDGTVYVIAAGRANHAGRIGKGGVAGMPKGADGNALAIGQEVDTNGTQKLSEAQRHALAVVNAVNIKHFNRGTAYVHRHADISGTGKWDIGNLTTAQCRSDAAAALKRLTAPPKPPVTTHTRWATKTTGVYDAPNGKKLRDLAAGDRFEVIDGSGHGKGGWVETTFHNWVDGNDTATEEPKTVTSHTRWAVRVTGVHEAKGGKKLRDLQPGESFKVIDGSGHGNGGWIETTHGNWVLGEDTTTRDPALPVRYSVMTWNVENKGAADAVLDRAEVIELCTKEKPEYFCLQEVYRVDLRDIPGYQTYHAFEGYDVDSENRAQAILVRNDVALKIKQAIEMQEEWTGPKMGIAKEPRVHRYVTGNLHDTNIPVATFHVPFGREAVEETRDAAIHWLELMEQSHGCGIIAADWNSLADGLQAKVATPAGAKVYGDGLDKFVGIGVKLVKYETLGTRGRSDHPVKRGTFEA